MRHGLERSKWAKAILKTIGVLAVSMVVSKFSESFPPYSKSIHEFYSRSPL